MMKKIWLVLLLSAVFFSSESFRNDLSKGAIKKMNKTIASLWPEQAVTKKAINISIQNQEKLSFKLEKNALYQLYSNDKAVAFMMLSQGRGKMNFFDYMIIYKLNLSILKVKLLVYREEYGGEIGSNRWLKQFIGKSNPKEMKFGQDIQNISGATISVRSINEDIKKVTKRMIELKDKGII